MEKIVSGSFEGIIFVDLSVPICKQRRKLREMSPRIILVWNSVFLTESGKIIIKKGRKSLLNVSSYCRSRDFLPRTISGYKIARSNRFVLRVTEITLSLLPRQGVLNRVTLPWISFWNSAIWKKGLTHYPFPVCQEKEKEIYQKAFAKWRWVNWALLGL